MFGSAQLGHARDLETINFMSSNEGSCSNYPQFIMQAFGFLQNEGYSVKLLSSDTSVPYIAFLANGDADVVVLDAPQTLTAVEAGQPVKIVYESYQFAPEGIVVVADSPILSLADLKGKKIGLAEHSDEITTQIALDSVGISMDEVTTFVVGNQGPVMATALRDGAIDAFAGGFGNRTAIEKEGIKIRNITPDAVSRNPGNSLAVWGPTLEEKRPKSRAFVRAWAAAQHAGVYDTKAVIAACKTYIPEQFENIVLGSAMIDYSVFTLQLRRTIDYGEFQTKLWSSIQPRFLSAGVIKGLVDPATFLDDSFKKDVAEITTDYVLEGIEKWKTANPDKVIP